MMALSHCTYAWRIPGQQKHIPIRAHITTRLLYVYADTHVYASGDLYEN